jgi:hypothetical protein
MLALCDVVGVRLNALFRIHRGWGQLDVCVVIDLDGSFSVEVDRNRLIEGRVVSRCVSRVVRHRPPLSVVHPLSDSPPSGGA